MKKFRLDYKFTRRNSAGDYEDSERFYEIYADNMNEARVKADDMFYKNEPDLDCIIGVTEKEI